MPAHQIHIRASGIRRRTSTRPGRKKFRLTPKTENKLYRRNGSSPVATRAEAVFASEVKIALLGLAALFAAASVSVAADDTYKFKITNEVPTDDPLCIAEQNFADRLEEESGGRIQCTVYSNGELSSNSAEALQMAMDGTVQFSTLTGSNLALQSEALKEFSVGDYPFIFDGWEDAYKLWDSDLGAQMLEDVHAALPVYALPAFGQGWNVIASNKEVTLPEDLSGQKIRVNVNPLYTATFEKLPCTAFSLAFNEVYTALQQGMCDGLQTSASTITAYHFYEVQKNVALTHHSLICLYPVVNAAWYDALPDDLKEIFDKCAGEFVAEARALHEQLDIDAVEECAANGMNVVELTDEQREVWKDALKDVITEKADEVGAEFLDQALEVLGKK